MMQIKSRYGDSVLFECEAKSIKECLEQGVARGANLGGAYLGGANLGGANFRGANLRGAYLRGANLRGADFRGAYLGGEKLTKAPTSILNLHWDVLITSESMTIGCQRHTHEAWANFSNDEIEEMHREASKFWSKNKGWLLASCKAHRESNDD